MHRTSSPEQKFPLEAGFFQSVRQKVAKAVGNYNQCCNSIRCNICLENTMRRVIGTLLILSPLFAFTAFACLGVLLGSMGMDIHWTSKGASCITIACSIFALGACVMAGVRLRRN
jgi:hypothetical protein